MEKLYNVKKADGTTIKSSYEDVCKKLGFISSVKFVEITNRGAISFTVGKPQEVRALLSSCCDCGFVPSESLKSSAKM